MWKNILLAMIMALMVAQLIMQPVHAGAATLYGKLTPSVRGYKILAGTGGSKLGYITFTGSVNTPSWDRCELTVDTAPAQSGLYAVVLSKECIHSSGGVKVVIKIGVRGTYTGGDFNWNPFSVVRARLYRNSTAVATVTFTASPIPIKEVKIKELGFGAVPIDTSSISYSVIPRTKVQAGTTIYIVTTATINLVLELTDYLTVPTTVSLKYTITTQSPNGQSTTVTKTTYVTLNTNSLMQRLSIPDVPLNMRLPINVINNKTIVYSTVLDVPTKASEMNVGGAVISTADPLEIWENQAKFKVISQLYIEQLQSGYLTITMTVNGRQSITMTYVSPGPADNLYVYFNKKQDKISGEYEITYNGPYGNTPVITVMFSTSFHATTGTFLRDVFYILFSMIMAAGFTGVVVGLLLRRPELQTGGMIMLASGVFIFLIPTLMGYVVALLVHTGIEDPVGISNLNMFNLGDVVSRSIDYIQGKAYSYSGMLYHTAIVCAGIVGILAPIVSAGGAVGWLTAGALSEFLGRVLGALGAQMLTIATLSFMASIFLKILGIIFPIVLNVVFTILLFTALIQALYAGFTGSYGHVFGTVMSLSVLILTVLVTPCILSSLDYLIAHKSISIPTPWGAIPIPDIFTVLGLVIVETVLIAMILAMAFQQLMSVLSGRIGQ